VQEPILELLFRDSPLSQQRLVARGLIPIPKLSPPQLPDLIRAAARRNWEARTQAEYVGVMVMRRLHGLLVDLNAPLDLQSCALTMLLEEQQHVRLCAAAARSLGSEGILSFPLSRLQQPRLKRPEEDLLEMIAGTLATGETTALALVNHSLHSLPPSGYRKILLYIARDEVLHARLGCYLLRSIRRGETAGWLPDPGLEAIRAVAERWRAEMRRRDVVEDEERRLFKDPEAARLLPKLGIPDSATFYIAYQTALDEAVPRAFQRAGVPLEER